MAEKSPIEWTDHTWSPWEGCTKVSPGCDRCYAESMNRWLRKGSNWGPGAPRREFSDEHWLKPVRWNEQAAKEGRRVRVFPSVCDPFDNEVDEALRGEFFWLVEHTQSIDWLVLTKRIGNAARMLQDLHYAEPLPNLWLGATVVNQEEADRDIPKLLATPARVRFLSMEPLLGPVDLRMVAVPREQDQLRRPWDFESSKFNALQLHDEDRFHQPPAAIDWVIVGGESGRGARPMHPAWARSLRDQCAAAGVPFLFKQHGEWAPGSNFPDHIPASTSCDFEGTLTSDDERVWKVGKKAAGRLLDGREHNEFPVVR